MSNTYDLLRYPVGKFSAKDSYTPDEHKQFIQSIQGLPTKVETVVSTFTEKQWDTPYRDGGWTARQVVHHLSDSHMHAYIRIKWTLTENHPTIKPYDEKRWAETAEVALDPKLSLTLLKAFHIKWVELLKRLTKEDLANYFVHPDTGKQITLERILALYSWHGEHHLGHLKIIAGKA